MERSEKVFKEFIDLCREVTNNDTVVLELLQKRYNHTNLHFLWSNDFPDLIDRCRQKIQADRDNKFVYIKEFTTELKAYKAKPLKHLRDTRSVSKAGDGKRGGEASSEMEPPAKKPRLTNDGCSSKAKERFEVTATQFGKTTSARQVQTPSCTLIPLSMMCDSPQGSYRDSASPDHFPSGEKSMINENVVTPQVRRAFVTPVKVSEVHELRLPRLEIVLDKSDVMMAQSMSSRETLVESSSDGETDNDASTSCPSQLPSEEENTRDSRLKRHIEKLELLLKKISDEIKRLQETELSLDDLDRGDSTYALEDRYKKKFVQVWNRLCKLKGRDTTTGREVERKLNYCGTSYPEVNKSISRFVNKFHVFPDFGDIHEIITRCNRKHDLGIRKRVIERLARETFTEVGNILQKRRMADHLDNFGCHLTENVKSRDDPALFDSRLRHQLEENLKVSKTNLEKVITKYAQKQDEDPREDTEEEEDDEEEEEEEEDEKKFLEEIEKMEEIVLTDESHGEDDEERNKENESKENALKNDKPGASSLCGEDKNKRDSVISIDMSTNESLSLLLDSFDDISETQSTQSQLKNDAQLLNSSLDCFPTQSQTATVVSSDDGKEEAGEVESVNDEQVKELEEESMDVSIVEHRSLSSAATQVLPLSSATNIQPMSPSISLDSSDIVGCVEAALPSPSVVSASDDVEPVDAPLDPVAVTPVAVTPVAVTPVDVICLDDETNSPVKMMSSVSDKTSSVSECEDRSNGAALKESLSKDAQLMSLALVRLKPPGENMMRRLTRVDTGHRKALSLRQPTPDASPSPSSETLTPSSDEEDVVEILSIPAPPNGRGNFTSVGQEVRSSQVVNTTQVTSTIGRRNGSQDECCIVTTVEEKRVVSTVMTSREERSSGGMSRGGGGGRQVEMRQEMTKKTMRVVGQIVHFNTNNACDGLSGGGQKQQMMTHGGASRRIVQMNQQRPFVNHQSKEMNRPPGVGHQPMHRGQMKRGGVRGGGVRGGGVRGGGGLRRGLALPAAFPLNKQLDDISSQIVSSIFKNQPKKSSSSDSDVIICDDSSQSVESVSPATTNSPSKVKQQIAGRGIRDSANARKGNDDQAGGTVARGMHGSRTLPAPKASSQNVTNRLQKLSETKLPDVIELT